VAIIPVYIGYERMLEGNSYLKELRGREKKKESFWQLLGLRKTLKQNFGKVYLNFSSPIILDHYLDKNEPDWRTYSKLSGTKPQWLTPRVSALAELIMQKINATTRVNATSLVALVLLSTERTAIGKEELAKQLDLLLFLMKKSPYSSETLIPKNNGLTLIEQAKTLGTIDSVKNPMGEIITTDENTAILLTYYRNNILHVFMGYALVASCLVNNERIAIERLKKRCLLLYPFLKKELFMHWSNTEFSIELESIIQTLIEAGLLTQTDEYLFRVNESPYLDQLFLLSEIIKPILVRYGILLTVLSNQTEQCINRKQLEKQSQEIAQRLAALYSINAPESFDKNLFKTMIHGLRKFNLIHLEKEIFSVSDDVIHLHLEILENINENSKQIMQKTADWAKNYWNEKQT
jgi:glycerol-3-phosphate O-acyltransferase